MAEIHSLNPYLGPITGNEFFVMDVPQGAGNLYATMSIPVSMIVSHITSAANTEEILNALQAAQTYAQNAQTFANTASAAGEEASNAANTLGALLTSFRSVFLGAYVDDAAADAAAVALSVTKSAGLVYENTTTHEFRIWNGTAWVDQDASVEQAQQQAALAASQAATSKADAQTAAQQAGASALLAAAWATQTSAEVVPGQGYGSKKYSEEARGYRDECQNILDTIAFGNVKADWTAVDGPSEILNKPTFATVATTGAYSDLTGAPVLATSATTDTTNANNIVSGTLASARLPSPTSSDRGAVFSSSAPTNQFCIGINSQGQLIFAQPTAADISGLAPSAIIDATNASNLNTGTLNRARLPIATNSGLGGVKVDGTTITVTADGTITAATGGAGNVMGPASAVAGHIAAFGDNTGKNLVDGGALAPSATTDTTNAANITSGTLAAARLPNPTSGALGGVKSATAPANNFVTGIDGSGALIFARPIAADIQGLSAAATAPFGTTAGTVMQGNDPRIAGGISASNNLSELTNKATARVNLGITVHRAIGNVDTNLNASDRIVATSATFTQTRTWVLPSAAAVPAGEGVRIVDSINTVNQTTKLTIAAQASEQLNGAASMTFANPGFNTLFVSDGVSRWTVDVIGVERGGTGIRSYTAGQILIGKNDGTLAAASLQPGTGITITPGDGTITIATSSQTPQSTGTVTSVQLSGGSSGLIFSGGPITTQGTISLAGGVLGVQYGGTGVSSLSSLPQAMGLGSMSQQNASSVAISGGTAQLSSLTVSTISGISSLTVSGNISCPTFTAGPGAVFAYSGGNANLNFANNASIYGNSSFISCGVSSTIWTGFSGSFQLGSGVQGYKDGGGVWSVSSDARMKEDVRNYKVGLMALRELRPVSFRYNGKLGSTRDGREHVGLIAQEVEKTSLRGMVQMIQLREGDELRTIDANRLTYILINAVIELADRLADLERDIA